MARRPRHDPEDDYEYAPDLPSTTRAVAWSALFFALIALVVSLATLFLSWRDGVLTRNAIMLSDELSRHWGKGKSAPATVTPAPGAKPGADPFANTTPTPAVEIVNTPAPVEKLGASRTESEKLQGIRTRLEELEQKILSGDKNVPLNLEQLRREMEGLRSFASDATNRWINPALGKLKTARDLVQQNGPQAASMLKVLANDLSQRIERPAAGRPAETPGAAETFAPTDPEALPQPESGAPPSAPLERKEFRPYKPAAEPPANSQAE